MVNQNGLEDLRVEYNALEAENQRLRSKIPKWLGAWAEFRGEMEVARLQATVERTGPVVAVNIQLGLGQLLVSRNCIQR